MRLYLDAEVRRLMGELTNGLQMSNTLAAAAINQATQSLAVPSDRTASGQAGGVPLPLAPTPPAAIQR